jgi:predicted membrane protein
MLRKREHLLPPLRSIDAMRKSRLFGLSLIMCGASLLTALLYEPSTIGGIFGLDKLISEANVVLLSLLMVVACCIGGVAALKFRPRSAPS